MADQELLALVKRLEAVATRLEGSAPGGETSGPTSASLVAFDDILNGPFKTFLELSKKIGSEVATIGEMVEFAFKAQRSYLELASKAKQPPQGDLPMLLKPMSDKISEIQSYRESGRRCQYFNHLSAISESVAALGWVTVSPAPGPFVRNERCWPVLYQPCTQGLER